MLKDDILKKYAEILAAQQAKVNAIQGPKGATTPTRTPAPAPTPAAQATPPAAPVVLPPATPAPTPAPEVITPEELSSVGTFVKDPARLASFTIIWNEGRQQLDGRTFTTWKAVNEVFNALHAEYAEGPQLGYIKVKVCIKWSSGQEITDRVDVGNNGDYNPADFGNVGNFLKRQKSAYYASNLQEGDRVNLQWHDDESTPATPAAQPLQPCRISVILPQDNRTPQVVEQPTPAQPQQPEGPELSTFTLDDIFNSDLFNAIEDAPATAAQAAPATIATAPQAPRLTLVIYSRHANGKPKSLAIFGETEQDTKSIKTELQAAGGKFVPYLTHNGQRRPGYIYFYSERKEQELRQRFNID